MTSIAKSLNTIYNFRACVSLDGKGRLITGDGQFRVKTGEELFGRHGDIKPENILWFERIPQHQRQRGHANNNVINDDDECGILQITDFGLGRFHGRRTEQQSNGVFGSPTYEPPECKLRWPVSRMYDLWSLGCLYLDFATWLLKGYDAIYEFSEHRACQLAEHHWLSDEFFKVLRDEYGVMDAVVRDGVKNWAQKLHDDEKCSEFIHDLVDLLMEELLCIDAKDRIQTPWLYVRLKGFLDKAEADSAYLCKSDRRPREYNTRTVDEATIEATLKKSTSPEKVSFREQGESSRAGRPESPKDLAIPP